MNITTKVWEMTKDEQEQLAQAYEARASECGRRKMESEEFSDTDGFLTQWAMGQQAFLYRRLADWARDGGLRRWTFLAEKETGRILRAKIIDTQYGICWRLAQAEEDRFGRRWIPVGERSRIQKQLGLEEVERDCKTVWFESELVLAKDDELAWTSIWSMPIPEEVSR